jgi:hypothetical protein
MQRLRGDQPLLFTFAALQQMALAFAEALRNGRSKRQMDDVLDR